MTPLTLLVLAGLAVVLVFAVRRRGKARSAGPPASRVPAGDAAGGIAPAAPHAEGRIPRLDDHVQFTVYRPRRLAPEAWCTVLAFAHLAERPADAPPGDPDPVEEVRRQARQALGEHAGAYADTTQDSSQAIPREGDLTFVLDLPGLEVNPPQRSFRWLEDVHREEFRVRAPATLDGRTVRGALRVHLGVLLVAEVTLAVDVAAGPSAAENEAEQAHPYRRIFPSYSHRDAAIVQQVEAYARTMGDEYLRDVTQLRSGEVWNDRLLDFIRTADVFQLFWSRNSMASPWVRQEWEYALALDRPHFIRPTYWETPMPEAPEHDLPPAALRALHFQRLPLAADGVAPPSPPAAPAPAPPPAVEVPDRTARPRAPAAPAPVPARHRRRFPTALAALLLVGVVGSTLVWRTGRVGGPPVAPPAKPALLQAISPDGARVASMHDDGRIVIAARNDPAAATVVIATAFRPEQIAALRFSPDGSRIVCRLGDGTTVEWDAETGARVARAPGIPNPATRPVRQA